MAAPTDTLKGRRMRAHIAQLRAICVGRPWRISWRRPWTLWSHFPITCSPTSMPTEKGGNERRLECVQALQLVKKLRATKIDVEI